MTTALKAPPYGRDLSCTTHIKYTRVVSGGVLLGQAAFRRLTTKRGSLQYNKNYGLPISDWLGQDMTEDFLAAIPALITNELMKDERLDRVDVALTVKRGDSGRVELDINIDGVGLNGETFALALHVNDVTVELLKLEGT